MEQSVDKAISIDEWTGETLSSSMVDDVFYILRMCSYRALDTANLQALTAVLGQLNTLLATNLAQALDQRWKVPCMHPTSSVPRAPALHIPLHSRSWLPPPPPLPLPLRLGKLLGRPLYFFGAHFAH